MKDIYAEITNAITEQLEKGIIPWKKPWSGVNGGAISHTSGRPYSLINQLMLSKPGEYLTFNQCKKEGGSIKKGARSNIVVFWKVIRKEIIDENGEPVKDENDMPISKAFPVLRYYQVFHIDDCENIKPRFAGKTYNTIADASAEDVFNAYITREHITFEQTKSDRAYYSPKKDLIHLPLIEQFENVAEYCSTMFHEATHSTGHSSRLDRLTTGAAAAFGGEDYSKEELTAEIGAACILREIGIDTESSLTNSAAYIQSWLRALKNDKKLIVGAAARAEKAVKYILNVTDEEHEDDGADTTAPAVPVSNLNQLKKALHPGATFTFTDHHFRKESIGQIREVNIQNTVGIYSKAYGDPESPISKANGGKGFELRFGKASEWKFENGLASCYMRGNFLFTVKVLTA